MAKGEAEKSRYCELGWCALVCASALVLSCGGIGCSPSLSTGGAVRLQFDPQPNRGYLYRTAIEFPDGNFGKLEAVVVQELEVLNRSENDRFRLGSTVREIRVTWAGGEWRSGGSEVPPDDLPSVLAPVVALAGKCYLVDMDRWGAWYGAKVVQNRSEMIEERKGSRLDASHIGSFPFKMLHLPRKAVARGDTWEKGDSMKLGGYLYRYRRIGRVVSIGDVTAEFESEHTVTSERMASESSDDDLGFPSPDTASWAMVNWRLDDGCLERCVFEDRITKPRQIVYMKSETVLIRIETR